MKELSINYSKEVAVINNLNLSAESSQIKFTNINNAIS